jgi:hypothetical protein
VGALRRSELVTLDFEDVVLPICGMTTFATDQG